MRLFEMFESDMCAVCGQTPCNCTHITESQFNSKQEVIDYFVKQGKSAAAGASAWERGWRGPKTKTKPHQPPKSPQQKYWWQDKDEVEEDKDPCWDNYKQIGMKTKNGRKVPNCVPK